MVYIVGIGPGSREYILPKAIETLECCDIVIGFQRAVESLKFLKVKTMAVESLSEILGFIVNHSGDIAIVASGDPCFYGITDYITRNYKGSIEVIPGLSSFQYLFAKLNKSWQGSFLGSLHGREEDFIYKVKESNISVWLTDKKHSPNYICDRLMRENLSVMLYIGENLSYEDEKITKGKPEELMDRDFSELCVAAIEKLSE